MNSASAAENPAVRPSDGPSASSATILIVDDHEPVTRALSRILSNNGYTPVAFHNAQAALDYVASNPAPSAALIDIHLPDLSGLVLTSRLRSHLGDQTPILILSGDTSLATLRSLPHVGATYYFAKPVNPPALLERLKELLTA